MYVRELYQLEENLDELMTINEAIEKGYWSAAFNSEEIEDF